MARVIELFSRGASHGTHCFLASPTRIKDMMSLVRSNGGVVPTVSSGDRRIKRLVPTAKLIDPARRWLREFLQVVRLVLPLPDKSLDVSTELLGEILSYIICAYADAGFILYEGYPEIRTCMAREAGYHVLMHMISTMRVKSDGTVVANTPFDRMSKQFRVARATIRNAFMHLARDGYIEIERGGHSVTLSPHFVSLCDHWIALELTWMHGIALTAWHNLPQGP